MTNLFLRFYYYASRIILFIFISIKVLFYGILHPVAIFNFLFGVITEVAEFHKRCGGKVRNFKESKAYWEIKKTVLLTKSNYFNSEFGNIKPVEAQVMAALISAFQPKRIFEIGTYNGFSTLHLAENSSEDTLIYTLDLPDNKDSICLKHDLGEAFKDIKNINLNKSKRLYSQSERKIIQLFGDSKNFDFSKYEKQMDFVFIDANHSYAYVKADTENAFKMLSPRGVILWHDYDFIHPGVFRLVREIAENRKVFYIERTRYALFSNNE